MEWRSLESLAEYVMKRVLPALPPEESQHTGGYFRLFAGEEVGGVCQEICSFVVGNVPEDKLERYKTLSAEKALRLLQKPEDVSSWQSRNPVADQWGGAVRGGHIAHPPYEIPGRSWHFVYSLSGLTEHGDEAFSLWMARRLGEMPLALLDHVITTSGNTLYRDLCETYRDELFEAKPDLEGTIRAPFTPSQVEALNSYQKLPSFHPFTCGNCRDTLIATMDGWKCPSCPYTQSWAHCGMVRLGWQHSKAHSQD